MLHSIKNIKSAEPYNLTLEFDSGEVKTIDLEEKLIEWGRTPDSKFKYLLDPANFKKVKINPEIQTIYWENGIDFCPDVLYSLG
ncbi:MAG: DUF2442 domain-containing protein [Bacteroidetes bacterium]|nr:DUF2442 domain-containing protein [Bacteroidota bacterium]